LFEGTGNVLQESANLFWDNTNGRLGIGTSTPAQFLDIQGTVSADVVGVKLRNTAANGYTEINCFNNAGTSSDRMYMGVGGTTAGGAFQNRGYFFSASNLDGINFTANKATTGDIRFFTGGLNERLRIFGNGNIGVNTTTDAGFRLDVNGTARVSGLLTATNGFNLYSTTNFHYLEATSSGSADGTLNFRRNGAPSGLYKFQLASFLLSANNGTGEVQYFAPSGGWFQTFYSNGAERMRIVASTGNLLINTTTDAGFRLDVNGTARVVNNFTVGNVIQNGGNANTFASIINHMGAAQSVSGFNTTRINANTDLGVGFAGAPDASAVVELRGTTKGFLPPRMTTTQRNAIASPAAGLIVYDTTLNLPHFFNGTIWVSL
jgi:hypothetical protein